MVRDSNADGINNVSTIEMATGAPNAILAINSLDRYITNARTSVFRCTLANGSANVVNTFVGGAVPIVGSVLTIEPEYNGNGPYTGWPPGVIRITAKNPVTNSFTISSPATANNPVIYITATSSTTENRQPLQDALYSSFRNEEPSCNSFEIRSPGALIYGYIQRITVSQIQLQYNIPTVIPDVNDILYMSFDPVAFNVDAIVIPFGFYSPDELAAVLETLIRNNTVAVDMDVSFDPRFGFKFNSALHPFTFVDPEFLEDLERPSAYKMYRLLGLTTEDAGFVLANTIESSEFPNFLYTPYIDILSDVLTNYQTVKDTSTSTFKPKGLIARVYLSGSNNVQGTTPIRALGSEPFVVTADLNSPKIIRWSPDVAVPNIDFQLRDCYGDLIPDIFPTEFQMTLLCVEGREWNS